MLTDEKVDLQPERDLKEKAIFCREGRKVREEKLPHPAHAPYLHPCRQNRINYW